jgi:hypothetical protein
MRLVLHVVALLLPALLLGWLELLVGRLLLPQLGGTPAVWSACLLFFQFTVLVGYLFAHLLGRLPVRAQVALHVAALLGVLPLLGSAFVVPAVVSAGSATTGSLAIASGLLWQLVRTSGPVSVVLCLSSPLFQRWYGALGEQRSADPYFLYAASNLGTLVALAGQPLLLEPLLATSSQTAAWRALFLVFVAVALGCGALAFRSPSPAATTPTPPQPSVLGPEPGTRSPWRWALLSFLPCSLLHGVTTVLTTDVAAAPLLWALPMLAYFGSYALAFLPGAPPVSARLERWLLRSVVALGLLSLLNPPLPTGPALALHLGTFTGLAWALHRRLAAARPAVERLSTYYLVVAAGGVAGGLFNSLLAPLLFDTALEYPAGLLLAALVVQRGGPGTTEEGESRLGRLFPMALGVLLMVLVAGVRWGEVWRRAPALGVLWTLLWATSRAEGLPRGKRWLAGALLGLLANFSLVALGAPLQVERSFFAVHRVVRDDRNGWTSYLNGTTLHGRQRRGEGRGEPLTYYHRAGPTGALFRQLEGSPAGLRVGLVGLGIGSLAANARPGDRWTFFELDEADVRLAEDPTRFTYLSDARQRVERGAGGALRVELGDGRLLLGQQPGGSFDLLVIDAFSSDSVPVHLLTVEAFQLYVAKLTPGGTLALHITNRFLDLEPVVASAGHAVGLEGVLVSDEGLTSAEALTGRTPSRWVFLRRGGLPALGEPRARPAETRGRAAWTDDHAAVLSAIRWPTLAP